MMRRLELFEAWRGALMDFSVKGAAVESGFAEIVERYGEDGRYYHTLEHVEEVLEWAAEMERLATDYAAVRLAAWFHDVVYDTRAADNEQQSAVFAGTRLAEMGVPGATVERVKGMILATADHVNRTGDVDTDILLDADLAILGSGAARFRRYCQAIRKEYGWVPEDVYRAGRIGVLERFLARERIYRTGWMFGRLEERARSNLVGEIGRLS